MREKIKYYFERWYQKRMSECACCMDHDAISLLWCGNTNCSYYMCHNCTVSVKRISILCPCCRVPAFYQETMLRVVETNAYVHLLFAFWCMGYVCASSVNILGTDGDIEASSRQRQNVVVFLTSQIIHGIAGCVYILLITALGTFAVQFQTCWALITS